MQPTIYTGIKLGYSSHDACRLHNWNMTKTRKWIIIWSMMCI
uniref:Uncharacterized protein n=1 Tax=Anguilla anguilla TaxID=7936 RepID=A0A0E9TKE7_ANGAN